MFAPIYTIGHSKRSADEFVALLQAAQINVLVDVRAYPASKRHPQFTRAALESVLRAVGISYVWEGKALGGMRKPQPDSAHIALEVEGFRGYADHMQSEAFSAAMARLIALAQTQRVAIMCAEKNPSECHRAFIADWLVAHAVSVMHLIETGHQTVHRLNVAARPAQNKLIYDRLTQADLF